MYISIEDTKIINVDGLRSIEKQGYSLLIHYEDGYEITHSFGCTEDRDEAFSDLKDLLWGK